MFIWLEVGSSTFCHNYGTKKYYKNFHIILYFYRQKISNKQITKKNKIENFNLLARANMLSELHTILNFSVKKWSKGPKKFKMVKMTKKVQNYQIDQNGQNDQKLRKS